MTDLIPPGVLESLNEGAVQAVLANVADAARNEWIKIAGAELSTSRRDYLNGIQPVEMKPGMATITLVGKLPNLIEQGMPATDMRDTLLGPNVPVVPPKSGRRGKHKDSKGGYYRSIPFRHGTPSSGGAVGQPMGKPYSGHEAVADAKKLGQRVYAAAKKLAPSKSTPYGRTMYGGRLPEGLAPKLRPHHATDIYAGMIREQKTYERATQSQYMTFRTISTRNTNGWLRPATPGRMYSEQVREFAARLATKAFEAYVGGAQ